MRSKESVLRLHRFRFEEKRQQVNEIEVMVGEFNRKLTELVQQIEAEEIRSGVDDSSSFNYSMTAKSLRTRHDNLVKSLEDLDVQLTAVKLQADETEAELRKIELMVEKEGGSQTLPGADVPDTTIYATR